MKIYICGPMRGIKYYNFPTFFHEERLLKSDGHEVINPARLDVEKRGFDPREMPEDSDWSVIPDGFDLEQCVKDDVTALLECDAIYALPGYELSRGAQAEIAVARWAGKIEMGALDDDGLFPCDADDRKAYPVFTGLLDYFPNACAAVANHSHVGNEQHNPGESMHWAKEKSIGDGNQIVRHLMEGHLEAMAWRALELLERKLTGLPPFDRSKS